MTSRASVPTRARQALLVDIGATFALTLFSLVVVAGFARVFRGWGFFDNLAMVALVGHGVGLVLRRLRVPGWIAVPVVFGLLAWLIGFLHYRFTYSNLLPTSETIDLLRTEMELVREQFQVAVAPVLYGAGWDVLAAIGVALAVLLSDAFAFRAGARAEALVPGGVLFVFVSAVGSDRLRIELTVLLVIVGALTVMVLRRYHALVPSLRVVRAGHRRRLLAPAGVLVAIAIGLAAGFLGPRLPGADAEPLVDPGGRGGGGSTTLISPLVDIRSRLTNQGNFELFVMEASQESYWRVATLPEFDGQEWKIPDTPVTSPEGDLATGRDGSTAIEQELHVAALTGNLIPAAPDLTEVNGDGVDELRWSQETETLLKTGDGVETGDVFEMRSAAPRFGIRELARATSDNPPDPIYLALPEDFPDSVREIAVEVTAGADSPYDTALQLQHWFRDQNQFRYSLEAQSGHGNNALEAFLRERVGYCEQFAGAFAAMMRSLGFPTRVAVGFTPGIDTGGGSYSVLGKNAHAWPEVWFDDLGWVSFEPTPGRGIPGAENYTSVISDQDESGVEEDPTEGTAEQGAPATSLPGEFEEEFPVPIDVGDESDLEPRPIVDKGPEVPWMWLALIGTALLVTLAPTIVRRARRHAPASTERELGRLWDRSLAAMEFVGVHGEPTDTPAETAARATERFPTAARPLTSLASAVTEATYRENGAAALQEVGSYGTSELRRCANWTRQVERSVVDSLGPGARIRHHFTTWS